MSLIAPNKMKRDSWWLRTQKTHPASMSRILKGLSVCWSSQVLYCESCSVQESSATACRHCGFNLECSRDRWPYKCKETSVLFLGLLCALQAAPSIFFLLYALNFGGLFNGFFKVREKPTGKLPMSHHSACNGNCVYSPFTHQEQCLFLVVPQHLCLRIPPLFCRRNSPWRR